MRSNSVTISLSTQDTLTLKRMFYVYVWVKRTDGRQTGKQAGRQAGRQIGRKEGIVSQNFRFFSLFGSNSTVSDLLLIRFALFWFCSLLRFEANLVTDDQGERTTAYRGYTCKTKWNQPNRNIYCITSKDTCRNQEK